MRVILGSKLLLIVINDIANGQTHISSDATGGVPLSDWILPGDGEHNRPGQA